MSSQDSIGGAGGVGTRTTRLQREMAAARRALARPTSPVDEVLESVAARLMQELSVDPVASDAPTGEEESPVVCLPPRVHQHAGRH